MNLIINDFCQSLSSGISVCIDLGTTSKFSVANPYEIFKHISFTSLLNRMISDEVLLRGSVLQSGVRRSLLNTRGFKGFGLVPNLQFNTNTKMMSGNINFPDSVVLRDRSNVEIPISIYIWIPAVLLAFDKKSRSFYISKLSNDCNVPSFVVQLFRKVRYSICGIYTVDPEIILSEVSSFVHDNPQFIGTLLDPAFILSEQGIEDYIRFCNFLFHIDPSYVKTEKAVVLKNISYDSAFITTFNAIHVLSLSTPTARVLPENTFKGAVVPAIHIVDALLMNVRLFTKGSNITNGESDSYFESPPIDGRLYRTQLCEQTISIQIIRRALGIDENEPDSKGHSNPVNPTPDTPNSSHYRSNNTSKERFVKGLQSNQERKPNRQQTKGQLIASFAASTAQELLDKLNNYFTPGSDKSLRFSLYTS